MSTDLNAAQVVERVELKARQMGETEQDLLARLAELSETQAGVVARRQLAELGLGRPYVRSELRGEGDGAAYIPACTQHSLAHCPSWPVSGLQCFMRDRLLQQVIGRPPG